MAPIPNKGSTFLSTRAREPTAVTGAPARTEWGRLGEHGRLGEGGPGAGAGRAGNDPFTNPSGM